MSSVVFRAGREVEYSVESGDWGWEHDTRLAGVLGLSFL